MSEAVWQRAPPQALVYFLGEGVKDLASPGQLVALLSGAILMARSGAHWGAYLIGTLVVVLVTCAGGLVRYLHFRFQLRQDGLGIHQGVFKKTTLDVRFERVQSVNIEQGVIYRVLDLASVGFETAGAGQGQVKLPVMRLEAAEALKRRVDSLRQTVATLAEPRTAEATDAQLLLTLDWRDMLRIACSNRSYLLFAAAIGAVVGNNDVREAVFGYARSRLEQVLAAGAEATLVLGSAVALTVVAVLAAAAIGSAFLRFHNYQLHQRGGAFHARGGLMTRQEVVLEAGKVQQFRIRLSPVLRWLRRYSLEALPAGAIGPTDAQGELSTGRLKVPILGAELVRSLPVRTFGSAIRQGAGISLLPTQDAFAGISPVYVRSRCLVFGVLPALLAAAVLWPWAGALASAALLWAPAVAAIVWLRWRHYGYSHNDEGLSVRFGTLGYRVDVCLFHKAQAAEISQSPVERRNGLATLTVALASGGVNVPFIDREVAEQLRDYVLYKVESSTLRWY